MTLRSVLIIPATDAAGIRRALGGDADAVMVDLRQGPEAGLAATAAALGSVDRARRRPRIWVRPHPLDDPRLHAELSALRHCAPEAIVLSGVESAAEVEHLGALLAVHEAETDLQDGSTKIVAMIETSGALFELHRVARASDRLIALGWDGEALAADLGADDDREIDGRWSDPLQTARTLALAACADAKLAAIDSPFTQADADTYRAEAERAARDGFAGKFALSAAEVAILNAAFAARG